MEKTEIFIHPTSLVSPESQIGTGTKIWQFCTVLPGAEIGENCNLSQNVYVEGKSKIGNRVKIKNNVSIYECVTIEDDVFIGPSAVFTNVINPRSFWPRKNEFLTTHVQKGATIGANATVICGITVGQYAMIGAGSVITRSVPDYALIYGVPARQHGWVCYCGSRLIKEEESSFVCTSCNRKYHLKDNKLVIFS
nr:acyltransferase [uncultured Methanoregula sp.]